MVLPILSVLWLIAVGMLIARAVTQYAAYRQVAENRDAPANWPSVSLIVPARNEANNVEACLRALLAQDYPAGLLEIVLVDDASIDDTARIACSIALEDARLHVVHGKALPAGWKGKPFACWQGVEACRHHADWLCFIDCDTRSAPNLLRSAVGDAERNRLDLLSLEPFQELESF